MREGGCSPALSLLPRGGSVVRDGRRRIRRRLWRCGEAAFVGGFTGGGDCDGDANKGSGGGMAFEQRRLGRGGMWVMAVVIVMLWWFYWWWVTSGRGAGGWERWGMALGAGPGFKGRRSVMLAAGALPGTAA
ncbi:putative basic proline-rich protein-like isoform X1 [Iris pallida]|uniref:Basic proline-rich protein-like isoform X1 n=1 Tax=Iris pallida TaxID=29817 RepID=A0AAX6DT67_IRIPA|nr:putative basic proline-rich protein-like isoform X1 [Iris pallida]